MRQSPNGLWVYDDDGQREVPVEGLHDERMAELDEMYQALTTGRPVRHDGRWGTATLEVVLAIMQWPTSTGRSCCRTSATRTRGLEGGLERDGG